MDLGESTGAHLVGVVGNLKQEQVSVDVRVTGYVLAQEKPKMFAKGTEITHAVVIKKLNEILQARGKKGTDR